MLNKKQWIKEFKKILIKAEVPAWDRGFMLSWVIWDVSYKNLTPREAADECIDYMYGDPNKTDIV